MMQIHFSLNLWIGSQYDTEANIRIVRSTILAYAIATRLPKCL